MDAACSVWRKKAQDTGNFKINTEQQQVETKVIENKTVHRGRTGKIRRSCMYLRMIRSWCTARRSIPYPPIYYPPPGGILCRGNSHIFRRWHDDGSVLGRRPGDGTAAGAATTTSTSTTTIISTGTQISVTATVTALEMATARRNSQVAVAEEEAVGIQLEAYPQHRGGAPYGDRGTAGQVGGFGTRDSLFQSPGECPAAVGRQGGNLASSLAGEPE